MAAENEDNRVLRLATDDRYSDNAPLLTLLSTFVSPADTLRRELLALCAGLGRFLVNAATVLTPLAQAFELFQAKERRAKELSRLMHSSDEGLSSIQESLDVEPIDAWTLVILISNEREFGASELELKLKAQFAAAASSRARVSANALHHNEKKRKERQALDQYCREWAAKWGDDGKPVYRSKAALARYIADRKTEFGLSDYGAILKRIDAMHLQVPHWKTRKAADTKEKS